MSSLQTLPGLQAGWVHDPGVGRVKRLILYLNNSRSGCARQSVAYNPTISASYRHIGAVQQAVFAGKGSKRQNKKNKKGSE